MLRDYDLDRINLKILEHSPPRDLMKPHYRHLEIARKFERILSKRTSQNLKAGERDPSPIRLSTEEFFDFLPKKRRPTMKPA